MFYVCLTFLKTQKHLKGWISSKLFSQIPWKLVLWNPINVCMILSFQEVGSFSCNFIFSKVFYPQMFGLFKVLKNIQLFLQKSLFSLYKTFSEIIRLSSRAWFCEWSKSKHLGLFASLFYPYHEVFIANVNFRRSLLSLQSPTSGAELISCPRPYANRSVEPRKSRVTSALPADRERELL